MLQLPDPNHGELQILTGANEGGIMCGLLFSLERSVSQLSVVGLSPWKPKSTSRPCSLPSPSARGWKLGRIVRSTLEVRKPTGTTSIPQQLLHSTPIGR
jgi:hypothetical protein